MPTTLILHVTEPLNEWDVSKILLWSILCLGVKITNIFSFLNNIRSWYSYRNCPGKTDFNLKNKIPLQNYKKNCCSLDSNNKISRILTKGHRTQMRPVHNYSFRMPYNIKNHLMLSAGTCNHRKRHIVSQPNKLPLEVDNKAPLYLAKSYDKN